MDFKMCHCQIFVNWVMYTCYKLLCCLNGCFNCFYSWIWCVGACAFCLSPPSDCCHCSHETKLCLPNLKMVLFSSVFVWHLLWMVMTLVIISCIVRAFQRRTLCTSCSFNKRICFSVKFRNESFPNYIT